MYRYYFRVIEPYIRVNADLMDFLISLRTKYRVWLNESSTATTLATLSHEGTLCGVNKDVSICIGNHIHLSPIWGIIVLAIFKIVRGEAKYDF